jgi:hypothetical protein
MSDGPFLVPQTVFVGDAGRLVVPLAGFAHAAGQTNATMTDRLPFNENVIIKRVEIDVRAKQLLIDFTAFKPGVLEIPAISWGSGTWMEAIELPPLKVEIASILEREGYSIILSPPEKPLAAPGTFVMISGGTVACIALTVAAVFLTVNGPRHFHRFAERLRIRLLIYRTERAIQKTQYALTMGRMGTKEGITTVGEVFKSFLSAFYRKDYASYAAEDFLSDILFSGSESGGAVYRIFATCDKLKFSPARIEPDDAKTLIEKTLSCVEGWVA